MMITRTDRERGFQESIIVDNEPGKVVRFKESAYMICPKCNKGVRVNKPILGSFHLCYGWSPEEED